MGLLRNRLPELLVRVWVQVVGVRVEELERTKEKEGSSSARF